MVEKNSFALLETLARQMGCEYLSDLKYLDPAGRERLAGLVRGIAPGDAPQTEWNDALTYLTGQDPLADDDAARTALLAALENPA